MLITWKDIFIYRTGSITLESIQSVAGDCGYSYFLWNGQVFQVGHGITRRLCSEREVPCEAPNWVGAEVALSAWHLGCYGQEDLYKVATQLVKAIEKLREDNPMALSEKSLHPAILLLINWLGYTVTGRDILGLGEYARVKAQCEKLADLVRLK